MQSGGRGVFASSAFQCVESLPDVPVSESWLPSQPVSTPWLSSQITDCEIVSPVDQHVDTVITQQSQNHSVGFVSPPLHR